VGAQVAPERARAHRRRTPVSRLGRGPSWGARWAAAVTPALPTHCCGAVGLRDKLYDQNNIGQLSSNEFLGATGYKGCHEKSNGWAKINQKSGCTTTKYARRRRYRAWGKRSTTVAAPAVSARTAKPCALLTLAASAMWIKIMEAASGPPRARSAKHQGAIANRPKDRPRRVRPKWDN
jgi:hypothetical protein